MSEGRSKNAIWVVLVVVGLVWFFALKSDTFRPIYYPDKNDLTEYIRGPKFSTLENAREWVYEQNRQRGDKNWDYEIGKNPKSSKYGDIEICEKTLR